MSNSNVKYIIRNIGLSDLEQIRDIWTKVNFNIFKNINQIMMKIDPEGIFLAQDEESGFCHCYQLIFIIIVDILTR